MLNLYHYTDKLITKIIQPAIVKGYEYDENHIPGKYYLRPFMKPEGFWGSPDTEDNWYHFWVKVDLDTRTLRYKYHIKLDLDSSILLLDTVAKMYGFRAKYKFNATDVYSKLGINWQDVSSDYQGIFIDPYHYSLRLNSDFTWYSVWDCSSACIWDTSAIQDFTCVRGG